MATESVGQLALLAAGSFMEDQKAPAADPKEQATTPSADSRDILGTARISLPRGINGGTLPAHTLRWKDISFAIAASPPKSSKDVEAGIPNRTEILSSVSGALKSGEMLAIMGGSGSGKTTLLNVLAGRATAGDVSGVVLFDGAPRDQEKWPWQYAFVDQQDVFYPMLTVRELLTYHAKLRLRMKTAEREARIREIMDQLGLFECSNVRVGVPCDAGNGISGGQRKRLSVALELLTNPSVLFIDEPTSGLDAFTALTTVDYLRKMTTSASIMSFVAIHQPRENILRLFDKFLLISRGRIVFSGTLSEAYGHFGSAGHPAPEGVNIADFWLDVIASDHRSEELARESVRRVEKLHSRWLEQTKMLEVEANHAPTSDKVPTGVTVTSGFVLPRHLEYLELVRISLVMLMRSPWTVFARVAGTLIMGTVLSLLFWRLDVSTVAGLTSFFGFLTFFHMGQGYVAVTQPVDYFLVDRPVILRERAATMYRSSSLFLARLSVLFPFYSMFCVIEGFIFWLTVDLRSPGQFILSSMSLWLFMTILGLGVGAVSPTMNIAMLLGGICSWVAVAFSGYFPSADKLIPWARYIDIEQYTVCMFGQGEFPSGFPPRQLVSSGVGFVNPNFCVFDNYWTNFGLAMCLCFIFLLLGMFALERGTRLRQKLA
ncbi:P-loop containing nucleoside triphosphate hydrolase protein [Gonapodya prolifera JEL478]|uniref:p-loop containing nucleoside triphosphate hydrolase protein n=1 Tax=Gonapodya prolifera (strain JEL478) TaxID=1344416 RepID=A0A139AMC1_GONPJ|nr:P-loop containing nucleoside triphosphate hydrolase protein [Gonapodya prolifera JEL478]|eukprot:KXS17673.1 P-loop containing nucleoside triphosphate hydrolase protein [Gonapodya prolifera JEL478]